MKFLPLVHRSLRQDLVKTEVKFSKIAVKIATGRLFLQAQPSHQRQQKAERRGTRSAAF